MSFWKISALIECDRCGKRFVVFLDAASSFDRFIASISSTAEQNHAIEKAVQELQINLASPAAGEEVN